MLHKSVLTGLLSNPRHARGG